MIDVLGVAGDRAGANFFKLLYPNLQQAGLSCYFIADGDENGEIFQKNQMPFQRVFTGNDLTPSQELREYTEKAKVILTTPCVTAWRTGVAAINYGSSLGKITIIGGGLDFNHSYPQWVSIKPTLWLANNEFHKDHIFSLKKRRTKGVKKDDIVVTGNPIFDCVLDLVWQHDSLRKKVRTELGISDDTINIVYWSPGEREELCEENFLGFTDGLIDLAFDFNRMVYRKVALCLRLHPKLDQTIRPGYVQYWQEYFTVVCQERGIKYIEKAVNIDPNELNFSADIVVTERSTQGYLAAFCGIPTVFLILPRLWEFFREELKLKGAYLYPLDRRIALAAMSEGEIYRIFLNALDPNIQKRLRINLAKLSPFGGAAQAITQLLQVCTLGRV